MKKEKIIVVILPVLLFAVFTHAQYTDWQHSGTVYIITTPEGADLPASVSEQNFPLLVRLHKDFFDFSQAKTNSQDIRFASDEGIPLPYQIEEWDPAGGTASIWVRIPNIRGSTRQAVKMYWGKNGASSQSNGEKVFGTDAGFAGVWHLGDNLEDSTPNNLNGTNQATVNTQGIIGDGQRFGKGTFIGCGDEVSCLPAGNADRSMSAWINPASYESGPTVAGWGKQGRQHLSYMVLSSRGMVKFHGYAADPEGITTVPFGEWHHVALTISRGRIRFYLDGAEDHSTDIVALDTSSPSGCYIGKHTPSPGPWARHFQGALDEVRFASVARSADWMKLCYENQKPLQSLMGSLVQDGSVFSVSQSAITIQEGNSVAITGTAGGAQKVYWILRDGDEEEIYAVDRFGLSFDAGRVVGDKSLVLQFKAIYPNETKTKDIAVLIKEDIPEPVFTLKAPAKWDGRETIEISPEITNLDQMQAKGADELSYNWKVSGLAAIKKITPGKLVLKRAQNSSAMTVTLGVNNGGAETTGSTTIMVKEPSEDAWVQRTPAKDENPEDNQFYARDKNNVGTLYYNGTLDEAADSVYLRVYADDKLYKQEEQALSADKTYAFSAKLKPGLIKYKVEFGSKKGKRETVHHTATNLVCGDAYIIQGQSNAEAFDMGRAVNPYTSDWIRSYGSPKTDPDGARLKLWGNAVSFDRDGWKLQIGYWGIELAKQLVETYKVPIFIINGAKGGTRIDQHQRSVTDPTDVETIYGRLLWRLQQARLTHGIRGVLWHQGENDQGSAGPGGGWGWETYQQYFIELSAAWKEDYPNIQNYYIFQIWPKACGMGGNGSDNMLREVQRTLPSYFSNMTVMSTLGIRPPGGCHYPAEGYAVMARLIRPLVERDNYGKVFSQSITPPYLKNAYYTSAKQDEIALEFDQNIVWTNSLTSELYLDGMANNIASGAVSGKVITLKLKRASSAQKITYLDSKSWSQDRLLYGENGIAALTFCDVSIRSRGQTQE